MIVVKELADFDACFENTQNHISAQSRLAWMINHNMNTAKINPPEPIHIYSNQKENYTLSYNIFICQRQTGFLAP